MRLHALGPFLLVGSLLVGLPIPLARAQTLRLDEAVHAALRNDPEVGLADAAVTVAQGDRQRAGVGVPANPTLNAGFASDGPFAGVGERQASLSISQELWAPGQRSARVGAADAGVQAALMERDWALRRVTAETAVAYVRLASAQRRESVFEQLNQLLLRIDEGAARRASVGDISDFERNQVRLETAVSLAELARQRGEMVSLREDLARRIGSPIDPSVQLEDTPHPIAWQQLASLAAAVSPRERPDVVGATHDVERATGLVTVEKRERRLRPTLSLGWESDRSVLLGDDFSGLPFPSDAVRVDDRSELLALGVSFALPIFDRNKGAITAAIGERARAEAGLARTRQGAESQVRELLAQGDLFAQAVEALAPAADAGTSNLDVGERAWRAGQLALTDLLRERDRILRSRLIAEDMSTALVTTEVRLAASIDALRLFGMPEPSARGDEKAAP